MFMPLLHAIFEVLHQPAEDNDQSAALEKQMLRRSYFAFLQTVTGSGMSEVIANQGKIRLLFQTDTLIVIKLENWGWGIPYSSIFFVRRHIL